MSLTAGIRIGAYEIESLVGAGGMGEVYRARDPRLGRNVAIKVLSESVAADPERLTRFAREARLLASLNHPHIAQIYGFEELPVNGPDSPATPALVLEFVDGPTLADRVAGGPLPPREAIGIGRQIASALGAAHERGIVHRDLKPANVKRSAAGLEKVLDFGLAKALVPDTAPSGGPLSTGPSFVTTQRGAVVGTAAYMSPEQARGYPVDRRSDMWAFGVILFELLAGVRPFEGETVSDTIAAVLRADIDWQQLPPTTPPALRRLIRGCLERDPEQRVDNASDAEALLAELEQRPPAVDSARRRAWPGRWWWLGVATVGVLAGATALMLAGRARATSAGERLTSGVVRFAVEPPEAVGDITNVTLAPDARFLVFLGQVAGESRLFLKRVDSLESRELPGTGGARGPFVSSDGGWIGFFRGGKIFKVSARGGDPLVVCDAPGGPGATWTGGNSIVYSRAWLSGLSVVSADGGPSTVLTEPDRSRKEVGHWWPSTLPDGRILFTVVTEGAGLDFSRVAILDPATRRYQVLFPGARASWIRSGHLLFYRAGRYEVVPFDLRKDAVAGDALPVLEDAQEIDPVGDWPQPVATSGNGGVAYLAGPYVPESRPTWIDAAGAFAPLRFASRPYVGIKLAPDGRRAASASLEAGRLVIRILDFQRGTDDVLPIPGMNWNPVWLPDGRLSFTSLRNGDFDVFVKDVSGPGAETAVLTGPDDTDPVAWTRDGRLVYQGSEADGVYPLKLYDPRAPDRPVRLTTQHVENGGSLSPDERWLLFHSAAGGRPQIYVRPLSGDGPSTVLSPDPGEFPTFLRDGRQMAFLRDRQIFVAPWTLRGGHFETGPARPVARLSFGSGWTFGAPFDVAPDGRLLALVRTAAPAPLRIRMILGWDDELGRLASRDGR